MQFSLFDFCSFDSRRGNRIIEVYVNWKCIAERLLSLPNKSSSFRRDLLSRPTTLAFTFKIINRLAEVYQGKVVGPRRGYLMAGCVRLYPLQRVTPLSEQTLWGTNWSTHINHQPTENWASLVSGLKRTRKQTRQPAFEKRGERPASVPNYFRVAVRANKAS